MKVTQVEVEFGMTQNLGDYTNTRPSIKLVAEIAEDESANTVIGYLESMARTAVHNIVDDELEAAGRKVKYFTGKLYQVHHSSVRQCIVLAPVGVEMPQESNWKQSDSWGNHNYYFDCPDEMRLATAHRSADALQQRKGYAVFVCIDGDLTGIPPLPDAGPEPLWHKKNLRSDLSHMRIDEEHWEELAALDHVNAEYLQDVRRELGWGTSAETFSAFIRENKPFTFNLKEDDEDDYEDEDWDDDDE